MANKTKDQCPYCKGKNCVPCVAYNNVENYGDNFFNVECQHCGKIVKVHLSRIVELDLIEKSNAKKSDF